MLVLSIFFISIGLSAYTPSHILNPRENPEACLSQNRVREFHTLYPGEQIPSSWIYDIKGYLKLETYLNINKNITLLQQDIQAEIGVLIVDVRQLSSFHFTSFALENQHRLYPERIYHACIQ